MQWADVANFAQAIAAPHLAAAGTWWIDVANSVLAIAGSHLAAGATKVGC